MANRNTEPRADSSPPQGAVVISALSHEGLRVETAGGKRVRMAVVDDDGNVIAAGDEVAAAAFEASVKSYRAFLRGTGHIRELARPVTP